MNITFTGFIKQKSKKNNYETKETIESDIAALEEKIEKPECELAARIAEQ